ncbi:DUF3341 domain-containing protein [Humisphaera borealis]|uniref:DUF3341 domain-containing protein n=1 Tax=Humisphaera borealis TaxID=2807512 RepID=A0A7M2WSA6_9BACT|nr:DUF3341 domain-containing protein [Humisphaera borealis]QOV88415.1 DUF3341 domain-containing protein [Humisphaera borealis]
MKKTATTPSGAVEAPKVIGLLAEFATVTDVIEAARRVRSAGYSRWDVHSPFPIHGIDPVMGIRPTRLPWLVLTAGLIGLVGGIALQWFANAESYPFLISGKPIWSLPANIPVAFETTILCAALTAVFGMLGLNRLPTHYNPLFRSERFRRATSDRFFILVDASDQQFEIHRTMLLFTDAGAIAVETVED